MMLLLAAALPLLYWDGPVNAVTSLTDAKIAHVAIPSDKADEWKAISGITAESVDPSKLTRLQPPGVKYRFQVSSATEEPWVETNAWRLLRQPSGRFYYEAPGNLALLAAAEAFMWGADAVIHTDLAGLPEFAKFVSFLGQLEPVALPARANIGFVDDGSGMSGEAMKLLARRNLLFRIVSKPDPALDLNVQIGSKEYTKEQARDPYFLAQKVRGDLGDDKRLVRVFGSEVTVARLMGNQERARLHLLNHAAARRPAVGVRVRVKGPYRQVRSAVFGKASPELKDIVVDGDGIEFTLPQIDVYAVVDLIR